MTLDFTESTPNFPWETLDTDIINWLSEDAGRGDITTDSLPIAGIQIEAYVLAKSDGVLAGGPAFIRILQKADPDLKVNSAIPDSTPFHKGDILISVTGDAAKLLRAERTALNLLNHLSGIATLTAKFVVYTAGTNAKIVDTRKTLPGLRALEKYAVRCGGGNAEG
jgi:nicotinate-nucleotide pyrophosphorylase (carboxylating)